MEDAEETRTETITAVTLNVGYPSSWQGILKITKFLFLFCCLICSAILVNDYGGSSAGLNYCLAISVIGFLTELVVFILYISGANRGWSTVAACGIILLVYHLLMLIFMYAACIVMTIGSFRAAQAYNAFGMLTIIGFGLDVYFNIIWIRGGPELAALSLPGL